ncbi:neuromodulin [Holotrichia oblita]|uniref:Neuromodulin n=1 Tax=Holotrichia oblita TaxID=644536 RepID=A0ACB9TZ16_HOLOL|nr:neuromodulin [Holotrichia oblita]
MSCAKKFAKTTEYPEGTRPDHGIYAHDQTIEDKADSAKTASTKKSSSSHSRPTSGLQNNKVRTSAGPINEAVNGIGDDEELEQAATKIQAAFRGHKSRKSMKQADKPDTQAADATEDLANEFRADDPELCNAATKIQASFRGHMARKKVETVKAENGSDPKNEAQQDEDFDIDLSDPDLNKAATKIQATFRTHMKHKDE